MLHLFIYDYYYPSGGAGDYVGSFKTMDDVTGYLHERRSEDFADVMTETVNGELITVARYRNGYDSDDTWKLIP